MQYLASALAGEDEQADDLPVGKRDFHGTEVYGFEFDLYEDALSMPLGGGLALALERVAFQIFVADGPIEKIIEGVEGVVLGHGLVGQRRKFRHNLGAGDVWERPSEAVEGKMAAVVGGGLRLVPALALR